MEVDSIRKIREELLNDYEEYNNDSIELLWDMDSKIWAKETFHRWMTWLTARKERWWVDALPTSYGDVAVAW